MEQFFNVAARALFSYVILLVLTRIMGKREISQMTFFDYTVGITIGSMAAIMATDLGIEWHVALPALLVFAALQVITAFISLRSVRFREFVDGTATTLIKKGNIVERNMRKERLNLGELAAMLREKNIFNFAEVEYAILENDGKLSALKKPGMAPVTPADMKLQTAAKGLPVTIIAEGKLAEEAVKRLGLSRAWIMSRLGDTGTYKLSDVMLAQVDEAGNLFVDRYDSQD